MQQPRQALERVFREEYGRIIAFLIRRCGSFDLAEEALQDAFTTAAENWEKQGAPRNPGAWLSSVAHRKLIDAARRERTRQDKQPELKYEAARLRDDLWAAPEAEMEYPDERLRLIFSCCHPALNLEAQVGLTLRTLGGLTTAEIARAFLVSGSTLAQRLVRAKNKIRLAGIPYEVPSLPLLGERLAGVQAVIYLVFNEGYSATAGDSLTRKDLSAEAIRLGRVLNELMPNEPENLGLLALMMLQDSRREARLNERGDLSTLEEQDRSRWDQVEIAEALRLLDAARPLGIPGNYQIQAAIAAVHARAKNPGETDWTQIAALYQALSRINASPVVALNRAVAVAMSDGMERGLELIDEVGADGALEDYYLFHAARADLLRRLRRLDEARTAYHRALMLAANLVEQRYLRRRLSEVQ